MTAQEMPTIVVSKLFATVGREIEKIRLEVPAKKFPSAALMSSNQLVRGSMRLLAQRRQEIVHEPSAHARNLPGPILRSTSAFLIAECKTQAPPRLLQWKSLLLEPQLRAADEFSAAESLLTE